MLFNFKKTSKEKLTSKLKEICHKEGISLHTKILEKICEISDFDIRTALNTLQLISYNNFSNNTEINEYLKFINIKEGQKNFFEVIDEIMIRKNFEISLKEKKELYSILKYK